MIQCHVRSSETSVQNACVKISTSSKVHVFKFLCFLLCDSYFRVLVLGRENLDLTKISSYTVPQQEKQSFTYLPTLLLGQSTFNDREKTTGQQLFRILSYVRLELSSLYMYVQ